MEPRYAAARDPDPDAAAFIRFCYRRRRVGWPELYDEMCAVAARGLFRGLGADDLACHGIGFSLFDMPALAAMASPIVAQEQALRRPMAVVIAPVPVDDDIESATAEEAAPDVESKEAVKATETMETMEAMTAGKEAMEASKRGERVVRFAAAPAGA